MLETMTASRRGRSSTETAWQRRRKHLARVGPAAGSGVLMLLVALVGATHPVLSWDEIATADAATRTPAQLWHLIGHIDGVFAAYYLFMHYWMAVAGAGELALRLPSIVAMAGAVALAAELGRRFFGPLTGAVAGLLLCAMPNTSRYADEARPYAFACFFALLALLMLHLAVDRPRALRWAGYGVVVVLLGLSHVVALTTLAAHAVVLAGRRDRRLLVWWSATVGAALVVLAPVMWLGIHERGAQLAWVPPLTAGGIWNFPGMVVGSVPGAWLLLGLALLGIWQPLRHIGEVTALALGPIVVVAAVSVLVAPYWVVRYMLIVLTPLALLAAVGLVRPRNPSTGGAGPSVDAAGARGRPDARTAGSAPAHDGAVPDHRGQLRAVALTVLTALVVLAAAVYPAQRAVRGATVKNGSDYRTAGQLVRRYQQPGDGIVYSAQSRTMRTGLQYYLRDDPGRPRDLLLARSAAATGTLRAQEYPDLVNHVRGTPRVWIFAYDRHDDPTTVRPALRPLLHGAYRQTRIWHLHRATLALFVARTAPSRGHK